MGSLIIPSTPSRKIIFLTVLSLMVINAVADVPEDCNGWIPLRDDIGQAICTENGLNNYCFFACTNTFGPNFTTFAYCMDGQCRCDFTPPDWEDEIKKCMPS